MNGKSTRIRLERAFREIPDTIAAEEGVSAPAVISSLHSEVLQLDGEASNFTSPRRCACLIHLVAASAPAIAARAA